MPLSRKPRIYRQIELPLGWKRVVIDRGGKHYFYRDVGHTRYQIERVKKSSRRWRIRVSGVSQPKFYMMLSSAFEHAEAMIQETIPHVPS